MPQRHLDRLSSIDASFLHQEGPTSHMHIGGVLMFEGPPPPFDDYLDHDPQPAAPGAALPAEARHAAARQPAGRCGSTTRLQHRVPRPPHRAAAHRAARSSCSCSPRGSPPSSSTATSRCGRLAGRGARGRPLRADLQDPPLARRRRLRASTWRRCCSTSSRSAGPARDAVEPWQPQPEPSPVDARRRGVRGAVRAGIEDRRGAVAAVTHPGPRSVARCATPPRASARSPGPGSTPPRRRR